MKNINKRKREIAPQEKKEISNKKTAKINGKKLKISFEGKSPIELLPTHKEELSPITDFKISYQIRQAIKSKSIIPCNTLISLV